MYLFLLQKNVYSQSTKVLIYSALDTMNTKNLGTNLKTMVTYIIYNLDKMDNNYNVEHKFLSKVYYLVMCI